MDKSKKTRAAKLVLECVKTLSFVSFEENEYMFNTETEGAIEEARAEIDITKTISHVFKSPSVKSMR